MPTKKAAAAPSAATPNLNLLEVIAGAGATLSPAQKTFKLLLAGLEKAEINLQELSNLRATYRLKFDLTLGPLQDERDGLNRDLLLFLKAQKTLKGLTKTHLATIKSLMEFSAENLLGTKFEEDTYGIFADELENARANDLNGAQFSANLESLFGVDLDSDDPDEKSSRSTQELWEETLRQMGEEAAQNRAKAEEHANKKRGGKKTAKQAKLEQENIDAVKLIKDIYRKLTSALHPDREPDEAERVRKTALMVEVNKAYAANNLLQLLRLQFQVIKVDANAAASLADEKLVLVNRSLKQQLTDLEQERRMLQEMIREEFRLQYSASIRAKMLEEELADMKAGFKEEIRQLKHDLKRISLNEVSFKAWLKQAKYDLDQNRNQIDDETLNAFLMDNFLTPNKKRR